MAVRLIPERRMRVVVARNGEVRRAVANEGRRRQARVEAKRARHVEAGHARVSGFQGRIDWNIDFDDERGQDAVLSIELGRFPYLGARFRPEGFEGDPGHPPLRILRQALVGGSEATDIIP